MSHKIDRKNYSSMFGPTVGDKVRLGDTDLWVEIEKDFTVYGDELKFGFLLNQCNCVGLLGHCKSRYWY